MSNNQDKQVLRKFQMNSKLLFRLIIYHMLTLVIHPACEINLSTVFCSREVFTILSFPLSICASG